MDIYRIDNINRNYLIEFYFSFDRTHAFAHRFAKLVLWISDWLINSVWLQKTLDANKYATKKTIAQGLLDVALLTANASQLKYILQVGEKHEFYTLMLTLIIISIILQVSELIKII